MSMLQAIMMTGGRLFRLNRRGSKGDCREDKNSCDEGAHSFSTSWID
jgi:hypothetical protein